jgi:hypothetical protein
MADGKDGKYLIRILSMNRELGASLCSSLDVRCGSPGEKQQQGQFVEYLSLLEKDLQLCNHTHTPVL